MKMFRHVVQALLLSGMVAGTVLAADGPWVTDWDAAKEQAAKEKKTLLIDFSGSDWCGWCIKLDKEVFSQDAFQAVAKDKYVMVLLDFPRDKSGQSAELQKQNEMLKGEFPVRGFPSVFLATADGVPFAQTGYQAGGPEAYVKHLGDMLAKHARLAKLEATLPQTKGLERAKTLDGICENTSMEDPKLAKYATEIMELDADNKAGLKAKYAADKLVKEAIGFLQNRKVDEAKAVCDKALAMKGVPGEKRQMLLMVKAQIAMNGGDKKSAKALLLEAQKAAPETPTGKQITDIVASPMFKDVE